MKASGVNLEEFVKMPINDLDTWSFTWSFFVETYNENLRTKGPIISGSVNKKAGKVFVSKPA